MLPRMIKLKPRRKTDGQCNTKKNKRILGTSIEQRPEHINSREEKGHFEIDAVKGKNGKNEACIITLVDRKSRYTYFSQAECPECQQGSAEAVQKDWKKEFQVDNFGQRLGIQQAGRAGKQKHESVLCTSVSSYERGTNENTNGLIREFLPKGKSMNGKEKEISEIQKILNERCRKILNYRSAEEYHFDNTTS